MKRKIYIISVILLILCNFSFAQKSIHYEPTNFDTTLFDFSIKNSYSIVTWQQCKGFGARFGFGIVFHNYGDNVKEWIGDVTGGPTFDLLGAYKKLNFGFKFKPTTSNTKKDLDFEDFILPNGARININNLETYFGYSLDLNRNFSVEPFVAYNYLWLHVINEDKLGQEFNFDNYNGFKGFNTGVTLNKYLQLGDSFFFTIFASVAFGKIDFPSINESFENNYWEWNAGLAYKLYKIKPYSKRIKNAG